MPVYCWSRALATAHLHATYHELAIIVALTRGVQAQEHGRGCAPPKEPHNQPPQYIISRTQCHCLRIVFHPDPRSVWQVQPRRHMVSTTSQHQRPPWKIAFKVSWHQNQHAQTNGSFGKRPFDKSEASEPHSMPCLRSIQTSPQTPERLVLGRKVHLGYEGNAGTSRARGSHRASAQTGRNGCLAIVARAQGGGACHLNGAPTGGGRLRACGIMPMGWAGGGGQLWTVRVKRKVVGCSNKRPSPPHARAHKSCEPTGWAFA